MRVLALLCAAALLATLAPTAAAHGAPDGDIVPSGPFYRVLADFSDDCGGDGITTHCQDTNDLISLDIQEKYEPVGDLHVLVFRITMDEGKTGQTLKVTTSFQANGQARSFSVQTTDNQRFTGSGTERVLDARTINDGKRYQVDAILKLSSVGSVGEKLSNFQLAAFRGTTKGDIVPGTSMTPLGTEAPGGNACSDNSCPRKVDYTLQGPTYYATLELNGGSGTRTATAGQDLPTPIQITLQNKFGRKAQSVTVTAMSAEGVTAGFHAGGDGMSVEYHPQIEVGLGQGHGTTLHLNLHGERAGASGTLTITATTDLGGRTELKLPYTVREAGGSSATSGPSEPPQTSKGSPTPAAALFVLALLGAALRRRA